MFGLFKRKKTAEERYREDLERRKRETVRDGCPDAGFALTVEDVFTIHGRGTVVTGRVARGSIAVGDRVLLQGKNGTMTAQVDGIEALRRILDSASEGDNVGILLRGVGRGQVEPGDVLRG